MIGGWMEWWLHLRGKPVFAPARARTGSPEWQIETTNLAAARKILDEAAHRRALEVEIHALWVLGDDEAAKRTQARLDDVRGWWEAGR
jgi:hypothetical protein